jgi:transposase
MYQSCCGLDVHKKVIVACLMRAAEQGQKQKVIRQFSTMTQDLLNLAKWLRDASCTHVAMESTGVYWKPIYNILEGQFELIVVNAQHMKTVPGRKTDVKDAEWIAELLQHGLLKASFIPPEFERELRDLTRYRTSVVRDRAQAINRLQKVLESANIKLAAVASDVLGVSARAILEKLLVGEADPAKLAALAKGRLREKRSLLEESLRGRLKAHHRFLIGELLAQIDYFDDSIERLNLRLREQVRPNDQDVELLDGIPGVNRRSAECMLAEMGRQMERFPTHRHLASWSGICPGNNESAGKRYSGKTRKGSPWLRQTLLEAAHGAAHTKNTYLAAQYHRLSARRGKKRALVAVAHSILVTAYHILLTRQSYQDLGANYFDQRDKETVRTRLVHRLEKLGYEVNIHTATP